MQSHLTKAQRQGTALFLGLCLICLAASILKSRSMPEAPPHPEAEAALRCRLNALSSHADTSVIEMPRNRRDKDSHRKERRPRKKQERRSPSPTPPPHDPFAPVPAMR